MKKPYKIIMNLLQRRNQKIKRENDLLVTPPSSMKVSDLCLIPDQFKFLWSLPRFFQTFSVSARYHLVLLRTTTYFGFCCCPVTKSCPTLCEPMDCSTPGLPDLHYVLEFAQIHVHWITDSIQTPHPLPPSSSFAFNLCQHQGLFQWVSSSH